VPFVGDTFMGILTQHMFEAPPSIMQANPNVQLPEAIEIFVRRALAKDPGERFQSCEELIGALDKAVRGVSPSAPPGPVEGGAPASGKSTKMGYGVPVRAAATTPQTLQLDEGEMPATGGRSNALLFVGLALVALALGGGGLFYVMQQPGPTSAPETTTATTEVPDAAVAAPDAWAEPDAFVEGDAGPEMISVGVVTTPPGARVEVMGSDGIACESSPCNLQLPLGQHLRLQAHLRNRDAIVEVDVVRDMAPVSIRLPSGGGGGARLPTTTPAVAVSVR
jgi:hypothetical protein